MNNKVRGDKNATCLHFLLYLLNICRKLKFLVSQGSVATCLRCKFHALSNSEKNWKSVKISQSYREFKGGNFLRHSVFPQISRCISTGPLSSMAEFGIFEGISHCRKLSIFGQIWRKFEKVTWVRFSKPCVCTRWLVGAMCFILVDDHFH